MSDLGKEAALQPRKVEQPTNAVFNSLASICRPYSDNKKTYHDQEKNRLIEACEHQILSARKKLEGAHEENIKPLCDLIDQLKLKIQDISSTQFEMA